MRHVRENMGGSQTYDRAEADHVSVGVFVVLLAFLPVGLVLLITGRWDLIWVFKMCLISPALKIHV